MFCWAMLEQMREDLKDWKRVDQFELIPQLLQGIHHVVQSLLLNPDTRRYTSMNPYLFQIA